MGEIPLHGVTTVIGKTLAKPALLPWAAKTTADYIADHMDELVAGDKKKREEILAEAKAAHTRKKDNGADVGTKAHAGVETYTRYRIRYQGDDEQIKKMVNTFADWAEKNDAKFLESEKNVYSKELWIGGILDFIVELDGKKYIGDFKTSSGIYPEYFLQCAAYELALIEMGYPEIEGYIIVNVDKKGKLKTMTRTDTVIFKQAFKDCLSLYKTMNNLDFPLAYNSRK